MYHPKYQLRKLHSRMPSAISLSCARSATIFAAPEVEIWRRVRSVGELVAGDSTIGSDQIGSLQFSQPDIGVMHYLRYRYFIFIETWPTSRLTTAMSFSLHATGRFTHRNINIDTDVGLFGFTRVYSANEYIISALILVSATLSSFTGSLPSKISAL